MPRCKNCPPSARGCYYTGKENTPRGRGFAAKYEAEGRRMKGTDGRMYVVSKTRSGSRWDAVRSDSAKGFFTKKKPIEERYTDYVEKFERGGYNWNKMEKEAKSIYDEMKKMYEKTPDDAIDLYNRLGMGKKHALFIGETGKRHYGENIFETHTKKKPIEERYTDYVEKFERGGYNWNKMEKEAKSIYDEMKKMYEKTPDDAIDLYNRLGMGKKHALFIGETGKRHYGENIFETHTNEFGDKTEAKKIDDMLKDYGIQQLSMSDEPVLAQNLIDGLDRCGINDPIVRQMIILKLIDHGYNEYHFLTLMDDDDLVTMCDRLKHALTTRDVYEADLKARREVADDERAFRWRIQNPNFPEWA